MSLVRPRSCCAGPLAAGLLALAPLLPSTAAIAQELSQLPPIPTEFPELGDLQLPSIEKVQAKSSCHPDLS